MWEVQLKLALYLSSTYCIYYYLNQIFYLLNYVAVLFFFCLRMSCMNIRVVQVKRHNGCLFSQWTKVLFVQKLVSNISWKKTKIWIVRCCTFAISKCFIFLSWQTHGFFRGLAFPLVTYGAVNSVFFGVYGNTLAVLAPGQEKPNYFHVTVAGMWTCNFVGMCLNHRKFTFFTS